MRIGRLLRHLCASPAATRRHFDAATEEAIAAATRSAEAHASGEIRFAVETSFEIGEAWAGKTPRQRAQELFAELEVWNTELRNGVLIYVLMAERDVEIVADRAASDRIGPAEWEAVCRVMEAHFRAERFREGSVAGIEAAGALLAREFPVRAGDRNEQPDQPALF
jgi:uncharacterized membrane protein